MGRILGIDHGDKRLGLALSDPLHMIASPFKTLTVISTEQILADLRSIIVEKEVEALVIGLPLGMKGQETEQTKHVRQFADLLKNEGYRIYFEDERLSSISAKRSLHDQNIRTGHNKKSVDRTAAAILLQQYLDKH